MHVAQYTITVKMTEFALSFFWLHFLNRYLKKRNFSTEERILYKFKQSKIGNLFKFKNRNPDWKIDIL